MAAHEPSNRPSGAARFATCLSLVLLLWNGLACACMPTMSAAPAPVGVAESHPCHTPAVAEAANTDDQHCEHCDQLLVAELRGDKTQARTQAQPGVSLDGDTIVPIAELLPVECAQPGPQLAATSPPLWSPTATPVARGDVLLD